MLIANFSKEELTLPKGTINGVAQDISENSVVSLRQKETLTDVENRPFLEAIKTYLTGLKSM
jgi:hypothetical protein